MLEILQPNTVILTPNRRLAAYYLKQYNNANQDKKCWPSIDILPITTWLERLWKECCYENLITSLLLSGNQELLLWEEIISQSEESQHLLQLSETAELAKSAWALLKQWQINLKQPELTLTEDSRTFLKWAKEFEYQCAKNRWLDRNSLVDNIIQHKIHMPSTILLLGFTELSPQYQRLLHYCETQNTKIEYHQQHAKNNIVNRIGLRDMETEIRTMANWAKKTLADKKSSIACIVPNLEDHRDIISRIFTEVFTEEGYYSLNSLVYPFNISAGKSLASYPILYTAFQLLQMHKQTLSIETFSNILRSPFLGDAEKEMLHRAEWENQLRSANLAGIDLTQKSALQAVCPLLFARINTYFEKIKKLKSKQTMSCWVTTFMDLLTCLGWPGERSLNSEEYQVVQRWVEILRECSTFEHILKSVSYSTALHYLKRLTANTVFQPQSPETSIQILGMLEAAEIPFDYLWIMGMDDRTWPPAPKPNPFIPQSLQKTLKMPHATAERELDFCKKLTAQLKNGADQVIFSYALHLEDHEIQASALLNDISEITYDSLMLTSPTPPAKFIFQHKTMEAIQDDTAPPIMDMEKVYGGAKIFELQALCPFKAFSELRLMARPIELITPGLRAFDRGNIVHKALELIWQELKNSSTLQQKTPDELQTIITAAIQKSIYHVTGETETTALQLELQRLQKLIGNWLALEKKRPAFQVIAQEQQYEVTIANITINVRIDRIDEVIGQGKLIIDYKTGKNHSPHHWFGERPLALQLPLYCVIDPEHSIGIAFATIHVEKMELKGVSKDKLNTLSIEPLAETKIGDALFWPEQLTIWRQRLEKLGEDFYRGHASVDPKEGLITCEHCQLKSFCRVYEKYH